jgi:hypothetical protein
MTKRASLFLGSLCCTPVAGGTDVNVDNPSNMITLLQNYATLSIAFELFFNKSNNSFSGRRKHQTYAVREHYYASYNPIRKRVLRLVASSTCENVRFDETLA